MLPEPETAVTVPPQEFVNPFGVATTSPAGKLSVTPTPESEVPVFGLFMVKVSDVLPPTAILAAPNALLIVGGATTVTVAVFDVVPVPPSVEVIAPVVLLFKPAVVPVTFTTTVQVPLVGRVPAARDTELEPCTAVAVPLQEFVSPFGVATTRPAGRLSVNANPDRATPEFGLVIVIVRLVVPFNGIVAAPKALEIVGGLATVRLALAVPPEPPESEPIALVVLFLTPEVVPVTLTVSVHVVLVLITPPLKDTEELLATAVNVAPPPQFPLLVAPGVDATVRPAGNVSVKFTPVNAVTLAAGFVIVNVSVVVPLTATKAAPNALENTGGATTLMLADAVVPVPPSVEVIALVVLFAFPAAVPVTATEMVQVPLAATLPPEKLTLPAPAVAVNVPPQVLVTPGVLATTRVPVVFGKVSVNPMPVNVVPALGLVIVNVKVAFVFSGMLGALNALLKVGGATTVREAFDVLLNAPVVVDVTVTLLFLTPAVVPVTSREIVQVAPAVRLAADRLRRTQILPLP